LNSRFEGILTGAHVERRLAAILAADVAGYSRLMGVDDVATLQALKAHRREVVDPAIAAHSGRIVKTTGDGMLVEFGSVVDAVTCAMLVQKSMADRNGAGIDPSNSNSIPGGRRFEMHCAGSGSGGIFLMAVSAKES